jgi:integrase
MGYVEQRKGRNGASTYRAQVRLKGHAPVSQSFLRVSDARQWIQKIETSMREGDYVSTNEAKKHTLSETIDRYIEDQLSEQGKDVQRRQKLEWFKKEIGFKRLSDVSPALISECRQKLKSEMVRGKPRSGSTTNRYCSQLSSVFEYAKDVLYWTKKNPVREVKWERENEGVIRFLSEDEKKRLISACEIDEEPLILPIVITALSTGLRKEELRNLTWQEVDLERGAIIICKDRSKNRTARRVPLKGKALELLKSVRDQQRANKIISMNGYVFPASTSGKPFDLRASWERVRSRAEITNFRFHDLRHSCASYLAMNGASLLEIADVLGHKTLAMVKRYAHLADSHTAGVVERMNEKLFSDLYG